MFIQAKGKYDLGSQIVSRSFPSLNQVIQFQLKVSSIKRDYISYIIQENTQNLFLKKDHIYSINFTHTKEMLDGKRNKNAQGIA